MRFLILLSVLCSTMFAQEALKTGVAVGVSPSTEIALAPPVGGHCRKLTKEVECPLDYWMVSQSIPFFDSWRSVGLTANHLTLMGGVVQLLACFFLWKRFTLLAALLWIFGYYFDGIDGSYARYHHLCSAYGDILDHSKDWICGGLLVAVLFARYSLHLFDYLFWTITLLLLCVFLGVQEQFVLSFKPDVPASGALSGLARLIDWFHLPPKEALYWLRWFGTANNNVLIALYIATLPLTRKKREVVNYGGFSGASK